MTITITFENASEYSGYIKGLLAYPFTQLEKTTLSLAYAWQEIGVLEDTKRLRARVSMSKTLAHLNSKNPAPVGAGNGIQK